MLLKIKEVVCLSKKWEYTQGLIGKCTLRECLKALPSFKSVFKRTAGPFLSREQKYITTGNMDCNIFGSPKPFWESDEGYKTFLHEMHILHFAYNFTESLKLIRKKNQPLSLLSPG